MPTRGNLSVQSTIWPDTSAALLEARPIFHWSYTSPADGSSDWALAMPPASPPSTTWIVNLHGHGSRGDQLYTRKDIREQWLPVLLETGCGILTPNLRGNAWMSPEAVRDLHDLLNNLRHHHAADRFIFISGSMGATGSLIYATQHPQDVAGLVALCPATDLSTLVQWCGQQVDKPVLADIRQAILQNYRESVPAMQQHSTLSNAHRLTMPLFLVHGDDDAIIPVDHSRELVRALQGHPALMYIEQPGGHHDAPLWLMPQGLAWVMEQLRQL